jgi:uncharacterized Zn finger protein
MTGSCTPVPLVSTLSCQRGPVGDTWWGRRFLDNLLKSGDQVRLNAGKTYARNGTVTWIEAGPGIVEARVAGSHLYSVRFTFAPLPEDTWKKFFRIIGREAAFAANLLAGTMPEELILLLIKNQISVFPNLAKNSTGCSCPDWGSPCRHEAAVLYLLAENIDRDPFLLFLLLGKRREEFLAELRRARREAAGMAGRSLPAVLSPEESAGFFEMKPSAIGRLRAAGLDPSLPVDPHIKNYLVSQLGTCPSALAGRNLAVWIAELYPKAAYIATQWVSEIEEWRYDR